MTGGLLDRFSAIACVGGLLALAVGYGFLVGDRHLPPRDLLAGATEAAEAFYKTHLQPASRATQGLAWAARDGGRGGAFARDPARTAPGPTFLTLYTPDGFEARLIAPDGAVLHRWRARHSEVFPEPPHLLWKAPDEFIVWHGAHLFPNGDVLFNFQDKSFPYGGGLVRLDRDSRVVWALPENTHHDVAPAEDGSFWVPGMRYRPEGLPETPHLKPWFYEDTVLRVSPEGEVLAEVSVLKALAATYPGLLSINHEDHLEVDADDPLHLNAVEPLPAAWAGRFPGLAAGDLLVSLRSINTVAVIDPTTSRAKWALAGPFAKQHDPDWLPDGRILLFDNRGGDPACGGSRVLELDFATQAVAWSYDGCGGSGLRSDLRGMQQPLPNGNLLVTESLGGRVLEVTRDDKRIVWEYVNALEETGGGQPRVGLITHAERIPEGFLAFLPGSWRGQRASFPAEARAEPRPPTRAGCTRRAFGNSVPG